MTWLESTIWPCSSTDPGGDELVTRGDDGDPRARVHRQLGDVGRRREGEVARAEPGARAQDDGRRCACPRPGGGASGPTSGARHIATSLAPPSVSSTGTTASAPSGIGAPVMIRSAWPTGRTWRVVSPAATSPATGSTTGRSRAGAGELGRAHGVPVHGRVVEARQVDGGHDVVRQHQAEGRPDRHGRGRQRRDERRAPRPGAPRPCASHLTLEVRAVGDGAHRHR